MIFLTDVAGWLADPSDPSSLVSETDVGEIRQGIAEGRVTGGMLPKLEACADAVEQGVRFAHIVGDKLPCSEPPWWAIWK